MTKTVMAFGSFDILHPGHLLYLEKAKRLGDMLIVVVARDSSITLFKKRHSALSEKDRLSLISSLKIVDKAILGNKLRKPKERLKIIKRYKPDVIAFGYDQRIDTTEVRKWLRQNGVGARVIRIRNVANEKRYKSSVILRKMLRKHHKTPAF
jgi:FAD synthetase